VADGGTVLLDEVAELSLTAQAKLLRVLEERVVTRLGSTRSRALDVRVISATNRDLEADCRAGRFREDLYYRLNGLSLTIPPLRERPLELEALARRFLASACRLLERSAVPELSAEVLGCLHRYRWPGNARELRHCMERAAVLSQGAAVLVEHLPTSVAGVPREPAAAVPVADLPGEIRSLERTRIVEALERSGGIQSAAARVLGISRRTLISRIEEYGLPRPRKHEG
jgi:transcriptional regulator with PAS, ATPase and Fis domain